MLKEHAIRPRRLGLIGSGIGASLTPDMHEREGAELGLSIRYDRIDIDAMRVGPDALPRLLDEAEAAGYSGVNITHPFKQSVIPLLHSLSEDADTIGAVNTVLFNGGKRSGHNTDWLGYYQSFKRGMPGARLGRVTLVGAGGGGCAVAHAALKLGVGVLEIADKDFARASALAHLLSTRLGETRAVAINDVESSLPRAEGLIHATPTGMTLHPGLPINPGWLRKSLWVSDIIYFPAETELLRHARALGCQTMNGGSMAVYQAVEAFKLFTDVAPDPDRMLRHFGSLIARR